MTKISKKSAYPKKTPVVGDYFVGTDSQNNLKTVNFGFEETAKLINELTGTSVLNYLFKTSDNIPLEVLTEGVFLSNGNETSIDGITKIYVNKKNFYDTDLTDLFRFMSTNKNEFLVTLRNSNNLNKTVYFNIEAITEFEIYFTFDISTYISNAAFTDLVNFDIYFFNFELKSVGGSSGSDPLKLDKSTYTGNAKNLDDRIVALENQTDTSNVFVEMQNFSFVDNVATVFSGWIWKLLGEVYTNPININFTIPYSATGKTRIEYIVPNNANGFTRIIGEETFGTAQAPQLPEHGLYVTFFIVTDSSIGIPESPNIKKIPTIQQVLEIGRATTKNIWFFNNSNSKCLSVSSESILFQKLESVFNFIRADYTTETYAIQLPNKLGGAEQTFAMVSDLTNKVDKITGKVLSTEDYTTSEKNKLASIDATHYLPPLQTTVQLSALPQAGLSDKARVYVETDLSDYFYDTTASSGDIAPNDQTGGIGFWKKVAVGGETAASIKTKYESNADTNAFTDALKAKLDSITAVFTTGLKIIYDGVVSDFAALLLTGSRLITSGEITKLSNTSNTNTGDETTATLKSKIVELVGYAAADETTPMTSGLKVTFRMPYAMTLTNVRINTTDAPTITSFIVDVKQTGTSVFSTLPRIDYGTTTSVGSATPHVISTATLTDNSVMTIHVTQVGSGAGVAAGTGLKVCLYGYKI